MLLPNAFAYIPVDATKNTGGTISKGDRVVLISAKNTDDDEATTADMFFPIGVMGTVSESVIQGYIAIQTEDRVNIDQITYDGREFAVELTHRDDTDELDDDERYDRFIRMKGAVTNLMKKSNAPEWWRNFVSKLDSIEKITAASSLAMNLTPRQKYDVLAIDSERERSRKMEELVMELVEISETNFQSQLDQNKKNQKAYRESAIRHQMEYLQKELDELDPEGVSDIRRLEKRIEESGMNEVARKEAMKALNRMKQDGQNGHEYGTLYDYIDFLTGLPWKSEEPKEIDLEEAEKILDEDHFGLEKVKDRIIQQIAVMNLNRKQYGTILLFVGAPGTGKTSIGQSIAKALGREYVRVSLGGIRDEAEKRGHRRTYIGAMPGRIMDGIHKCGSSNPVMMLDEVDKLYASYNGDPASALLEVLDPEQNSTFTDHYMNVPYDLSRVVFICTANDTDRIPYPLLNRMEIVQFPGYTPVDKMNIARRHLLPKAMDSMGISEKDLAIDDEAMRRIISDYTMEAGVRGLKKRIDTLCRIAAVNLVKGQGEPITVTPDNLRQYMGRKPIRYGRVLPDTRAGIVTGLCWTAGGGDIGFIESTLMPGRGKLIVTGQIGNVMKESIMIAVSLVQNMFPEYSRTFNEMDIHVHAPEGYIKKDGTSAGITVVTAISSLITGRTVAPEIAMTGEVSLRGRVMPVGGIPEKLMAAQRAGVKTVFIPQDNVDDLEDVADEVKEKLEIVPVTYVGEVLERVGIFSD
ncbi:MAG: endopeptidase La [Candidatus Methanomethylophilaceae archaeon]|nr:endopeptidase La [Candidatus Methanomethylophilaceae archaeon]